jgi:hypothetical protein
MADNSQSEIVAQSEKPLNSHVFDWLFNRGIVRDIGDQRKVVSSIVAFSVNDVNESVISMISMKHIRLIIRLC